MLSEVRGLRARYVANAVAASELTRKKTIEGWGREDSPLLGQSSFDERFRRVLPDSRNLKEYIEQTFAYRSGQLRGLELGGIGSALFEGFSPGFFARTAAVNLVDDRDDVTKQQDAARNHKVFPNTFLAPDSVTEVKDWLGEVDVLIEHMTGGQLCLPNNPFLMGEKVAWWLNTLSEDSLVLAQTPNAFVRSGFGEDESIQVWARETNETYPQVHVNADGDLLYLRKTPGSPKNIPLLSGRRVLAQELQLERLRRGLTG